MDTSKEVADSAEAAACVLKYAHLASCNLCDRAFGTQCFLCMAT